MFDRHRPKTSVQGGKDFRRASRLAGMRGPAAALLDQARLGQKRNLGAYSIKSSRKKYQTDPFNVQKPPKNLIGDKVRHLASLRAKRSGREESSSSHPQKGKRGGTP